MKDSQFNTLVQMNAALSDRIEEIAKNQEKFATKKDLEKYVTKKDLRNELKKYATKEDLRNELDTMANKIIDAIREPIATLEETVERHDKSLKAAGLLR